MKAKHALVIGCLIGIQVFAGGETCEGQQRRYQPSSPTVTPYLNLSRFNTGGLPNYYSLVRPQQQQRSFNARETALRQQQQRRLDQQQRRLDQVNTTLETRQTIEPTGKASWFMYPGSRQSFLNTSRYYPPVRVGR